MIHTVYKFRHYNGDGRLLWASGLGDLEDANIFKGTPDDFDVVEEQDWVLNSLVDEGEQDILNVYFKSQAVRTTLYFRLFNDTPAETDTLSTLTGEVTGTGYAPIAVTRDTDWGAVSNDGGDMKTTSSTKTFSASGTWTDATQLVLATSSDNTGLFIAYAPLSATRTLVNGDTLDVSMGVKLA